MFKQFKKKKEKKRKTKKYPKQLLNLNQTLNSETETERMQINHNCGKNVKIESINNFRFVRNGTILYKCVFFFF